MRIKRRIAFVLFLYGWALSPAPAAACNLTALDAAPRPVTVELDFEPRHIEVRNGYRFEEGPGETATIIKEISFSFTDFTSLYAGFVNARTAPGNDCDVVRTGGFETAIDPSGLAMGRFDVYYEDNLCFLLRFFEPFPGVRKDPMTQRLFHGTLGVSNAFQPALQNGLLTMQMATIYEGGDGSRLEKLYDRPLAGFLQEEPFLRLVAESILEGETPESAASYTVADIRFAEEGGRVLLKMLMKKITPAAEACRFHDEKRAAGSWRAP